MKSHVQTDTAPDRRNKDLLPGISLILPAFNEEAAIRDIIARSKAVLPNIAARWEIIVVSDGSTDDTANIARSAGAIVLEHPLNKGYGHSLKTGIISAAHERVAIMDADGSYRPEDLMMLAPFVSRFDMVVGQRSGGHFSGGPFKRAGRWLQNFLVEFTTGTRVPDVNSGLRIFSRDVSLAFFDMLCGGFSFTTSITLSMLSLGYAIRYVPVTYQARTGKSHVRYLRDTLRSLQIIIHSILRYNPIKAFLFFSFFPLFGMGSAAVLSCFSFFFGHRTLALYLGMASVLFLITSLIIVALGLVATTVVLAPTSSAGPGRHKA